MNSGTRFHGLLLSRDPTAETETTSGGRRGRADSACRGASLLAWMCCLPRPKSRLLRLLEWAAAAPQWPHRPRPAGIPTQFAQACLEPPPRGFSWACHSRGPSHSSLWAQVLSHLLRNLVSVPADDLWGRPAVHAAQGH